MNNLIIDFTGGEASRGAFLVNKLQAKGETVNYVSVDKKNLSNLPQATLDLLKKVDNQSRIYIIEHGLPNQTTVGGIHYQELAAFLANNIKDKNIHNKESNLKISLIPCFSGRGDESGLRSFAGLFHRYLGKQYKIYCEVVARNELVWTREKKYTATEVDHALMMAAEKMGVDQATRDSLLRHQHPGTKILLRWDKNGDEWVVDAYIDKFFSNTKKILNTLDKIIEKGNFDDATIRNLSESKNKLNELLSKMDNENAQNIDIMNDELNNIKKSIAKLNVDERKEMDNLIDFNINLSKASINQNSIQPTHSDENIQTKLKAKEENIQEKVEELDVPIKEVAKELKATKSGNQVKKSALELADFLAKTGQRKLKKEYEYKLERDTSRFAEQILYFLTDPNLSKEQKQKAMAFMSNFMLEEMSNTLGDMEKQFPNLAGAIQGVKDAQHIGGWMGIQKLPTLISLRSQEKGEQLGQLTKLVSSFIEASVNYVK